MPKRRYERREPTHDWQQIQPLLKDTAQINYEVIRHEYKHGHTFSDFWNAYQHVFPAETQRSVGKETGETAHIERWNNSLRQRVGRYIRHTLSFSKSDEYHHLLTTWFIAQ
jgi:insertion element IS1 protein InsB